MKTANALWEHVRSQGICPGKETLEEWLAMRWGEMRVGPWLVPVLPLGRRLRGRLIVHDIHHILTGWDTSYRGEAQLAAWELASGGCGWSLFFWLDRLSFIALGLVLCPVALGAALRRGSREHNLYGFPSRELLATRLEELERFVRGEGPRGAAGGGGAGRNSKG